MSSERTEKATPKRREDARKKGQIARRPELSSVIAFLSAIVMLRVTGESLSQRASQFFISTFQRAAVSEPLTPLSVHQIIFDSFSTLAALSVPVVLAALAAGVAGNLAQGGITFTPQALMPKPDAFNPVSRLKQTFGSNTPVELVKEILKISTLCAVCYGVFSRTIAEAPTLVGIHAGDTFTRMGETAYSLGLRSAGLLLVVAALDYGYGWYKNEKSMRMTKQEIKDEYRQIEGDPLVKSQRRRAARALTQKRIAAEVPRANVIVTNPTHFAVALRYDRDKDAAPIVVAKGADEMAKQIRKIAKAHDVPIVENPPLARTLYRTVKEGRVIPPDLFRAVAELLAYVYRQRAAYGN